MCLTTLVACGTPQKNETEEINNGIGNEMIVGGWTSNNDIKPLNIPKDAMDAFDRAAKEYDGMTFEPIALLGSQVVAGKNYMFLCKGTTVTQNPKTSLKTVIVYNDLGNNSEITLVKLMKLFLISLNSEKSVLILLCNEEIKNVKLNIPSDNFDSFSFSFKICSEIALLLFILVRLLNELVLDVKILLLNFFSF
jgi:hypothetical protein